MTNNGTDNIANFNNNIYDPNNQTHNGHHRIGTSATEIELLDELPPPFASGVTTHEHNQQKQSNNYHTLSLNRTEPKANVVYQDSHDQQLGYAVDKLLERYAPDVAPQNLNNTTTSRRVPTQVNVPTEHVEPLLSSFQTNHPSMSTTATSHNYSSIIRPNTSNFSQSQPQMNQNPTNRTTQSSLHSRPESSYDNFQHSSIPPSQQSKPSKSTIPIKTKDGLVTQVIPGKLYTLEDDPLHLLYDKQETTPSKHQSSFQSTFQPSLNVQHTQDPLSSPLYANTSQRYPHQSSSSITTDPTNNNHMQPFDLGNLIKRVQEDYLREIQPFVSSVKFVEKDSEFGQNLNDIGFTTPVTVRKGFTRQADDILRNSFGGGNHQRRQQQHQYDSNEYTDESDYDDDNIDELRSTNRQHPLQKFDSKQSFTSVTSASTHDSDYDSRGVPMKSRKKKAEVHDQGTSPPPRLNQTNTRPGGLKPLGGPLTTASKPITANEEGASTANRPDGVKFAARISSGQQSRNSMGSTGSESEDDYTGAYSDHDQPTNTLARPPQSVSALATTTPVIQPASGARDRNAVANQGPVRSEDIHPTPPTIRPGTNQNLAHESDTDASGSEMSGSHQMSDSDDQKKPSISRNPVPPSTTNRSNVQQNPSTTPGGRSATTGPTPNSRDAVAANQPVTSRTTVENNARAAAGAATNPATTARTTVENNARSAAAAGAATNPATTARTTVENNARSAVAAGNAPTNARTTVENNARAAAGAGAGAGAAVNQNLHFVPPDQRNAQAGASNQPPTASATAAQTGSTRLFHGDNDAKGKRSIKDAPSAVGNKIKSLFRRK